MGKSINILIAGVGGGSHGLEILKALRLSDINYHICGCDMTEQNVGFVKSDSSYVVPPAISSDYIPQILEICDKEKINVIFHGSDPDLLKISEYREVFEKKGILVPLNNAEVISTCLDKKKTFEMNSKLGIKIPKTNSIENKDDIELIDYFPVVVKPYVGGGGSNNTFIAQDKDELEFFCNYILKYGGKPLVQEYIGSSDNEYTVGVLSGKDGKIISTTVLKRFITSGLSSRLKVKSVKDNRKTLHISSGISQGQIEINDNISQQCMNIAEKIGSTGPLNIQCRCVDDVVYLFEINPRFSGTTYMRALAGVNEPDIYIRKYLLNEEIGQIKPKKCVILRGLEEVCMSED